MKKSVVLSSVLAGKLLLISEYRSFKVEPIQYRDKKSGAMMHRFIAKHSLEAGDNQLQVADFMPDDYNHEKAPAVAPFKKGTICVLEVDTFKQEKGFISASGELTPLEEDDAKPAKV